MKQLKLNLVIKGNENTVRLEHQAHRVMLNWDTTACFVNIKDAQKLNAFINTTLNDFVYRLNQAYADMNHLDRMAYYSIGSCLSIDRRRNLEENFNKIFRISNSVAENSGVHIVKLIYSIIEELEQAGKCILQKRKKRRDWEAMKVIDQLLARINTIKIELDSLHEAIKKSSPLH